VDEMKKHLVLLFIVVLTVASFAIPFSSWDYQRNPALVNFSNRVLLEIGGQFYLTNLDMYSDEEINFEDVFEDVNNFSAKVLGNLKFFNVGLATHSDFSKNYAEMGGIFSLRNRDFAVSVNYTFFDSYANLYSRLNPSSRYDLYSEKTEELIEDLIENGDERIDIGFVSGKNRKSSFGVALKNIRFNEEAGLDFEDLYVNAFFRLPIIFDFIPFAEYSLESGNLDYGVFAEGRILMIPFFENVEYFGQSESWKGTFGVGINLHIVQLQLDFHAFGEELEDLIDFDISNMAMSLKFAVGI
jgi:hypothetical protein